MKTRRNRSLFLVLSLIVAFCLIGFYGCGGGGSDSSSSSGPAAPFNVTGAWSGTWASDNGVDGGIATASLNQDGLTITGTFSITNSICFQTGPVAGTISGTDAIMTASSGNDSVAFTTSNPTASSMSGVYITLKGACTEDTGVFNMTK
jgi:hypothetical protein